MLAAALAYVRHGWPIFPCGRDKKPLVRGGFKMATTDEGQLRDWWGRWPDASIGCPTGPDGNGLFVLDVDLPEGPATLAALEAQHGPLPSTLEQRTGGGGRQLFFKLPTGREIRNSAGKLGPGLDVRGAGGYVILPPSSHPSGGRYSWASPKGTTPAEASAWLLDLICAKIRQLRPDPARSSVAYGQAALEAEAGKVAVASKGQRNATLNAAAFNLGQLVAGGQVDRAAAEDALAHAAARAGLPEEEARKTIASGFGAGELQPRGPEKARSGPERRGAAHLQPGVVFNPYRLFAGSFLPNALLRFTGISSTSKLVWARLAQYAGDNGVAWPSHATLAREVGKTPRHIRRSLAELEEQGFIIRDSPTQDQRGAHLTTRYRFTWHPAFDDVPSPKKLGTGASLALGQGCPGARDGAVRQRDSVKRLIDSNHEDGGRVAPAGGGNANG